MHTVPPGVTPPVGRSLPFPGELVLAPFRGVRYDPAVVGDLSRITASAPTALDQATRRRVQDEVEHSVLRLIIPRQDERHVPERAHRAADLAHHWVRHGVLLTDDEPALYAYEARHVSSGQVHLRGVVGALPVGPPSSSKVVPHERTRPGPVADQLALLRTGGVEVEPLVVLHTRRGTGSGTTTTSVGLAGLLAGITTGPPLAAAAAADDLQHRIWRVEDPELLARVAQVLAPRRAVIADGHHRWRTHQELLDRPPALHPGLVGSALALLVDADEAPPPVCPVHRVVPGLSPRHVVDVLASATTMSRPVVGDPPDHPVPAGWVVVGDTAARWTARLPRAADVAPGAGVSDVEVLHSDVFEQALKVSDAEVLRRTSPGAALALATDTGGTAFLLSPPTLAEVLEHAFSGRLLPATATAFLPKPLAGLVMRGRT